MRKVVWPAAKRAGITKRIGWHTFRRSLATLLIDVGAPVKLTQGIMRHANSRVTLELYSKSASRRRKRYKRGSYRSGKIVERRRVAQLVRALP
jgi:integrase